MSGEQPPQDESKPSIGKVTNDEKNLVVSFIQFLRHKVSSGQCNEDQIVRFDRKLAVQMLEGEFNVSDLSYAFQPSKPLLDIFVAAEGLSQTPVGKVTNDEKNLVVSFIQFLRHKVSSGQCNEEQIGGLKVAVQCLETVFNVSDLSYAFQPSKPLLDIFVAAEGLSQTQEQFPTPTMAEVEQANKLKEEGNELVKAMKLDEAIQKYNEAIKLNRDPIYFCNRAAAYCRKEQYALAIQDCRTALALDPNYAKAYGRMGMALSCQNHYDQAVQAYKKALEINPDNESYKQNLGIAQDKLKEAEFDNNPQASSVGDLPISILDNDYVFAFSF